MCVCVFTFTDDWDVARGSSASETLLAAVFRKRLLRNEIQTFKRNIFKHNIRLTTIGNKSKKIFPHEIAEIPRALETDNNSEFLFRAKGRGAGSCVAETRRQQWGGSLRRGAIAFLSTLADRVATTRLNTAAASAFLLSSFPSPTLFRRQH